VISVAFKPSLKTRLGICIGKTSHQPRLDEYIGFTPSCVPPILQQNCAYGHTEKVGLIFWNGLRILFTRNIA